MVAMAMGGAERTHRHANAQAHHARLQKIVLTWDYFDLVKHSKARQKERSKINNEGGVALKKVGSSFKDKNEYLRVFEPLLLEEIKAQIIRGEEEQEATAPQRALTVSCEKANEFYTVTISVQREVMECFGENDLLMLSKEMLGERSVLPSTYAFAMVEGRDKDHKLKLRMFLDGEFNQLNLDQISPSTRLSKMLSVLQGTDSILFIFKLSSLSTILREYAALRSVGSLPFADLIFSAQAKKVEGSAAWNIPKPLMEFLESNHNESQLEAIQAGLAHNSIVLIQGPPGTGKTQTILGILGALLHAIPARVLSKGDTLTVQHRPELSFGDKFENWMKASPWMNKINPRDMIMPMDGDDGFYPTTGNDFKPEVVAAKRKHRVHVLVCAPSNSALDEIVIRLMNTGIRDENGQVYNPSIVRVGLQAHDSVNAVTLDTLFKQRKSGTDPSTAKSGSGGGTAAVTSDDTIRATILDEAAIVCSTLSFSGSSIFSRVTRGFDVVIIDEAAQAVEPATLVPLLHGCKQAILVGDPIQLPATVLSSVAEKFGYGMSLFKRFQQAGYPVKMLKTQYRMHPQIREFPSREFYSEALDDGQDVLHQTARAWHEYHCFGPFSFFDVEGEESQPSGSGSWVNIEEVEMVLILYRHLVTRYPELKVGSRLAVISPYKQQVKLIRERIQLAIGNDAAKLIDVNTIDGFQGREKDVAIFSCVRANTGKGIGFVSDFRRMNVGITRARASMLVVGSASTLMQDEHWSNLVKSAQERECFFKVSKPYHSFFSDENLALMKPRNKNDHVQQVEPSNTTQVEEATAVEAMEVDQENVDDDAQDAADGGYDEDGED
ncbi:hypothetical protein SUGI_0830590 [Cryptomeria japonica]|nr:hypothetical protein SUGI_0830590 [Cryptomeria japonica]